MNIWYISKYAVTPEFGQATRQYFLSKYFVREGHNVQLITSQSAALKKYSELKEFKSVSEINGIKHVLLKGKDIQLGFSIARIISWVIFELRLLRYAYSYKGSKPDVVIVSSLSILTFISGTVLKRKFKSKLIIEVRDIWPLSLYEIAKLSKYNIFAFILSLIEKFGYKNADGIVGTMPKLDEHIKKTIKKDFKFRCIPMGYDEEYLVSTNTTLSNSHIVPENKFVVCYAGTIGKVNLVDQILEAAKLLNERSEKIHFAILGDGPLRNKYKHDYSNLSNVSFYNSIPKNQVNLFLDQCDLLVHPVSDLKIYKYGISPNKWIDYMLSSKPILVPYAGYPSMINEADCGFFIKPESAHLMADKIDELSKMDSNYLKEMGSRGKEYVMKNHKYKVLSSRFLEFIREC